MHHSSVVPFVLEKESSFVGILEGKFRDPNKARTFSGYGLRFRSFFRVTWWGARERVLFALFGCNLGIAHLVAPSPLSTIEGISTVEAPARSGNVEHN